MALTTMVKAIISADATQMQKGVMKAESSLASFSKKAVKTGKSLAKNVTLPMALVGAAAVTFKVNSAQVFRFKSPEI